MFKLINFVIFFPYLNFVVLTFLYFYQERKQFYINDGNIIISDCNETSDNYFLTWCNNCCIISPDSGNINTVIDRTVHLWCNSSIIVVLKQIQLKLYKEVIFGTKKRWPHQTGDLLKEVQFIWNFPWHEKKKLTF